MLWRTVLFPIGNPCEENEGDCDNDNECQVGLKCGKDCPAYLGFGPNINCCRKSVNGDKQFCTSKNPCEENEGDCDNDNECQKGLKCGIDNCPAYLGFTPTTG